MNILTLILISILLVSCGGSSSTDNNGTPNDNQPQDSTTTEDPGPVNVNSTTYYIDASSGDDNNPGSIEQPWKTLSKIKGVLGPDVQILLKRDETWFESLEITQSGTASTPILIADYGNGSLPVLDGSIEVAGWTDQGSGIYSKQINLNSSELLGNLSKDGVMLTPLGWNLDWPTTFSGAAHDRFSFDNSTDTIYLKSSTVPTAHTYRASARARGVYSNNQNYITARNLRVTRFSLHGVEFNNCTGCSVTDSIIAKTGGAALASNPASPPDYIYAGNGVEFGSSTTDSSALRLSISEIFDSGITAQTYTGNQHLSGILIADSVIEKCGFAGLEISVLSNGGSTGSSLKNLSAEQLSITATGQGWSGRRYPTEGHGIRIGADNGAGSMESISIKQSVINNSIGSGVKIFGECSVIKLSRLRINNNIDYGIEIADNLTTNIRVELSSSLIYDNGNYGFSFNSPNADGFSLIHNTFYNNTTINLAIFGQAGNIDIRNNLFYSSAPMAHFFSNSILSQSIADYNCYNDQLNMFGYNGSAYSSVTSFNTAHGHEEHGIGDGIIGMSNPGGNDFTLTNPSTCKNSGTAGTGVTVDFQGNSFLLSSPSSGAYQF
jgi:hypothetical protein